MHEPQINVVRVEVLQARVDRLFFTAGVVSPRVHRARKTLLSRGSAGEVAVRYVRELGGDPYFFAGETCLFDRAAHGGFGS